MVSGCPPSLKGDRSSEARSRGVEVMVSPRSVALVTVWRLRFGWCRGQRGRRVPGGSSPHSVTVRVRGFEPPRALAHRDLNPARLPSFATPACCGRDDPRNRSSNPGSLGCVVGRLGFEPRTCGLRARCAASCASDPDDPGYFGYSGRPSCSSRPSIQTIVVCHASAHRRTLMVQTPCSKWFFRWPVPWA